MGTTQLTDSFLAELFKLVFRDIEVARLCHKYLSFELIPKELAGYKIILREAVVQLEKTNQLPSLGVISQKQENVKDVQQAIREINSAPYSEKSLILDQLESFIKEVRFQLLSQKVFDLFNEGKKEDAIEMNATESREILNISLRRDEASFLHVFADMKERMKSNEIEFESTEGLKQKIPTGIDYIDDLTEGGIDRGDTVLWIMRSGVGKSTVARWQGMSAAMEGFPVLHIQLEGGKAECFDKYTQMWTKQSFGNIKRGKFTDDTWKKIEKTIMQMKQFGKEITIYGYQQFGEASAVEVRELCVKFEIENGALPALVIIDSLDLMRTGTNKKIDLDPQYKKERLQACAQRLKNIATEFNCVVVATTQTCDVPYELWNNPDKVIDRSHTEGDRTLVKPFSFVFTGNMTQQEKEENKARVYIDKLRNYEGSNKAFPICTNFAKGCFYDAGRTIKEFTVNGVSATAEINREAEKDKKRQRSNKI